MWIVFHKTKGFNFEAFNLYKEKKYHLNKALKACEHDKEQQGYFEEEFIDWTIEPLKV